MSARFALRAVARLLLRVTETMRGAALHEPPDSHV